MKKYAYSFLIFMIIQQKCFASFFGGIDVHFNSTDALEKVSVGKSAFGPQSNFDPNIGGSSIFIGFGKGAWGAKFMPRFFLKAAIGGLQSDGKDLGLIGGYVGFDAMFKVIHKSGVRVQYFIGMSGGVDAISAWQFDNSLMQGNIFARTGLCFLFDHNPNNNGYFLSVAHHGFEITLEVPVFTKHIPVGFTSNQLASSAIYRPIILNIGYRIGF